MAQVFGLGEKITAVVCIFQALLYTKSPVTVLPKTTPGSPLLGLTTLDRELNIGIPLDFCTRHRVLRQSESNRGGHRGEKRRPCPNWLAAPSEAATKALALAPSARPE